MPKLRAGIVGSSGYAGAELIRLLYNHPQVELHYFASRTHAGKPVGDVLQSLRGLGPFLFQDLNIETMAAECDVVFTAVPHGAAMGLAQPVIDADGKFIDLGTDFRFRDARVYEAWYGVDHTAAALSEAAVYGLPELFRKDIASAEVVGNPGCYPTSVLLGLFPLVQAGVVDLTRIVVSSMSGVSGAGSTPKQMYHFPECSDNVQPYAVTGHRHTPEIEQGIRLAGAGDDVAVSFTPHLVPMNRGILSTMVCDLIQTITQEELLDLYQQSYDGEYFVRVLTQGYPQTRLLWGSNFCDIAVKLDPRVGKVVVMSAIDNLGKGAAGQAIQNMNILFGLDERAGLDHPGIYP